MPTSFKEPSAEFVLLDNCGIQSTHVERGQQTAFSVEATNNNSVDALVALVWYANGSAVAGGDAIIPAGGSQVISSGAVPWEVLASSVSGEVEITAEVIEVRDASRR